MAALDELWLFFFYLYILCLFLLLWIRSIRQMGVAFFSCVFFFCFSNFFYLASKYFSSLFLQLGPALWERDYWPKTSDAKGERKEEERGSSKTVGLL